MVYSRNSAFFEVLMSGQFSVDSFFFLSGLLVAYFAFQELQKGRFSLVVYYVHRYIR